MEKDYPLETINAISQEVHKVISNNISGDDEALYVQIASSALIRVLGSYLLMIKQIDGAKKAIQYRELLAQRIHAFPIGEQFHD